MTLESLVNEARALSVEDRKRLVMAILDSLTEQEPPKEHSILEFEGIAAHLRDDNMDAQEYVNQLRREWDHRP